MPRLDEAFGYWREENGYDISTVGKEAVSEKPLPFSVLHEYVSGATPGNGIIEYDEGYEKKKRNEKEMRVANWLHENLGGDIRLLKESQIDGVRRPDYLWRGKLWDLKSTTTTRAANSAIKKGLTQIVENPGGIILNYENNEFDIEDVKAIAEERTRKCGFEFDLMIIKNDEIVEILHFGQ